MDGSTDWQLNKCSTGLQKEQNCLFLLSCSRVLFLISSSIHMVFHKILQYPLYSRMSGSLILSKCSSKDKNSALIVQPILNCLNYPVMQGIGWFTPKKLWINIISIITNHKVIYQYNWNCWVLLLVDVAANGFQRWWNWLPSTSIQGCHGALYLLMLQPVWQEGLHQFC